MHARSALIVVAAAAAIGLASLVGNSCSESPHPYDSGLDAPNDVKLDSGVEDVVAVGACTLNGNPALTFKTIPHGTFVMGSPPNEPQRGLYSETQVQVTLTHDFMITESEVTQKQWRALCTVDPSGTAPVAGYDDGIGDDYPVGTITYWEALSYANALSVRQGLPPCYVLSGCTGSVGKGLGCTRNDTASSFYDCSGYRLPTDAEYEYADRAGTTTATYAGDVLGLPDASVMCYPDPAIDTIARCCAKHELESGPVKQLAPNAFGLYDMLGNAAEWVDGTFNGLGYGPGPLVDPFGTVGATVDDAGVDDNGILRGGAFNDLNRLCRSAARLQTTRGGTSGPGWGLRLVRTIADSGASD